MSADVLAQHTVEPQAGSKPTWSRQRTVISAGNIQLSPAVAALLAAAHSDHDLSDGPDENIESSQAIDTHDTQDDGHEASTSATAAGTAASGPSLPSVAGATGASAHLMEGSVQEDAPDIQGPMQSAEEDAVLPTQRGREAGMQQLVLKDTSVTDSGLKSVFVRGSKCRHSLQHLNVSGCSGVDLSCLRHVPTHSALHTVVAQRCGAIRKLNLQLPASCALQKLDLSSCSHMHTLRVTSASLQVVVLQVCCRTCPCCNDLHGDPQQRVSASSMH